ncbi:MAG: hypothetical protein HUU37_09795, partial [Bdellovibrionales bacterium]|nr:hypothetical protein [Bdellovibrionales bacterium]
MKFQAGPFLVCVRGGEALERHESLLVYALGSGFAEEIHLCVSPPEKLAQGGRADLELPGQWRVFSDGSGGV